MRETPCSRVRFGPFEADLNAGELTNSGRPVRLQDKPFQVLAVLLDRPGEVVTREELRERLWPGDSFGDFDQGLNTAVNKLREALGDSAANPRFIETLPKRGYRFLVPAESPPQTENRNSPNDDRRRLQRKLRASLALTLIFAATTAGSTLLWLRKPAPESQVGLRQFAIRPPVAISSMPFVPLVAVSPNGRHIAFVSSDAASKLWVQDLEQQQPRLVEGSEGAMGPFWSPDSTIIAFAAGGKLKKIAVKDLHAGGQATAICDMAGIFMAGGSWSPDGNSIAFAAGSPPALYIVPASGGTPSLLVSPQMLKDRPEGQSSACVLHPHFLPSGSGSEAILFAANGSVVMKNLKTGRHRTIASGSSPFYSPTGHLLYTSGTDLWAQRFVPERGALEGEPYPVARNATDPSVASDGTLVYRDAISEELVWLDRRGTKIGAVGQPVRAIYYPSLSPDERRVAIETSENANQDVWVSDLIRGTRTRLSFHPATDVVPIWSPTGNEVAFSSYRAGNTDIFVRPTDAGIEEQPLVSGPHNDRASDWSLDGQYILYSVLHPTNRSDLWYLKRSADGKKWEPQPLLQTSFNEKSAKLSPDQRYVAYLSDESGRDEVYVRQFLSGGRKWPVSSRGASQIRWSRNGRDLFYVEAGTLIAVPVRMSPEFTLGRATRLFYHAALTNSHDPNYDVSADGQRFILPARVGAQEPMIRVVQNWVAGR